MIHRLRCLATLAKIRERERLDAQTQLIAAQQLQDGKSASLTYATDVLAEERRIATAGNVTMETFRVWFPSGLEKVAYAREEYHNASAATDTARLFALETAVRHKATETVFRRLEKERNDSHTRREQAVLDELSLRKR